MTRKRRIFGVITIVALALLQIVPAYALCLCVDASNCMCSKHIEEQAEPESCCAAPEETASDASCAMAYATPDQAFAAKGCDKHSVDAGVTEAVLPAVKAAVDDAALAVPSTTLSTDNGVRASKHVATISVHSRATAPPTYISHLALLI